MTLCSLDTFADHAGAVGASALDALLALGALDEVIESARADRRLIIRITVGALWLDRDQVPGTRPDWHIDRAGAIAGTGAAERYDVSDLTRRRSFALVGLLDADIPGRSPVPGTNGPDDTNGAGGAGGAAGSTEFAVGPDVPPLPDGWAGSQEVARDIRTWMSTGRRWAPCGHGNAVSFSARAVHRPAPASAPGWRMLLRVGAYQADPPMSPYVERIAAYNPFCSRTVPGFRLRPVGSRSEAMPMPSWSIDAADAAATRRLFATCGLRPAPERAAAAIARIRNAFA
ncbi:hypothetical protein [Actinomadura fibrosa]|uniref:Uncharacterized protein n=1 Tax=Actinomadura fibrosa TaxID=111802 RepID=A0ABW2XJ94_9ACTN|nr:hypothetical protein [Actinomadura fibrosa]